MLLPRQFNGQKLLRWLHIHISMALLLVLLFFALTGITLNHPKLLGTNVVFHDTELVLPEEMVEYVGSKPELDKEQLLAFLRQQGIRGQASTIDLYIETERDELILAEASLDFKAPGYNASVMVDIVAKTIQASESDYGFIALVNDLHKGRNSGAVWIAFLDITALLIVLFSITGALLLLPRKRLLGDALRWTLVGSVASVGVYLIAVP